MNCRWSRAGKSLLNQAWPHDRQPVQARRPGRPSSMRPSNRRAGVIDDIGGGGTDYNAIVISDNFGGGKIAGQFLDRQASDRARDRPVAIIKVEPSAVYAFGRGEGFRRPVDG